MFVSSIKVAILGIPGHGPFPNDLPEPLIVQYFQEFDQFVQSSNDIYIDTEFSHHPARVNALEQLLPGIILVNAVTFSAEELPSGLTRYNGWPGFGAGGVLEIAGEADQIPEILLQFTMACGLTCIAVPGQPGLVQARVVAMMINEAYHALGEEVSTRDEIDIAMKLGTNYPYGPFEWAERIGLHRIVALLEKMAQKEPKYQPAPGMVATLQQA